MGKPLVLLIRDGWGVGPEGPGNAVRAARTPHMDRLLAKYPHGLLEASGEAVGVRAGAQGSSEVGHLNMGAGRIVEQEIVRIDRLVRTGELFESPRLAEAVAAVRRNGSTFHLMGLVQDQGVHAVSEHLYAFLRYLAGQKVADVCIHFFADGRDTPPRSALTYLDDLQEQIRQIGTGRVGSVMGRYWAMDRAENWDRTEKAYRALTAGEGLTAATARQAIEEAYRRADEQKARGEAIVETDEFIRPTLLDAPAGRRSFIADGDAVLHFNYRQDRAIQLTRAFVEEGFDAFPRPRRPRAAYLGLTRYYDHFPYPLVPPMNMAHLLGEVLARHGLCQLRIAEFQKFRHVTSFFNGKSLQPYPGEDDIQVASVTVPEDQQPQMSALPVTELVLTAVSEGIAAVRAAAQRADGVELHSQPLEGLDGRRLADTYDVIVLNYANGDMVGHTGVFDAAVKAIETVDACLGRVVEAVLARDGLVLITSDHGNAEQMLDPTGAVQTAHTTNPVEVVLAAREASRYRLVERGKLADIAPTMLQLLGLEIPSEMTARSLLAT